MKNYFTLLIIIFLALFSAQLTAQSELAGECDGTLKVPGLSLEMNISLEIESSKRKGDLDIPKQSIKNMALGDLMVWSDSISFRLPEVPGDANYKGKFQNGEISGIFRQGGASMDLTFTRVESTIDFSSYTHRIIQLTDSILPIAKVAGLGVGVIMQDQIVLSQGFGYSDLEAKEKVDENTLFALGSTTKAFTAAGVAKLVSDGKIKWDEPIRTYIPEFELHDQYASQKINSIDLLCHRSGMPRHDLL